MKNDYKIGLVIGLLVLFLGVGYFIFRGPGKTKKPEPPVTTETTTPGDNSFAVETESSFESSFPPPSTPDPAPAAATAPPAATETVEPTVAKPAESTLEERVEDWANNSGNTATPATTETVAARLSDTAEPANETVTVRVKPAASSLSVPPVTDSGTEWKVPSVDSTPPSAPVSVEPVEASAPSTYLVQPNDVGWSIAVTVYGKDMGRYWTLIRDANPGVDMSNLQAGQKLKIPPLPESARQRMRDSAAAGNTFTDAAGQKIYIAKSGDSFWTISQKMYGKGYHYKEIQKANPHVKSDYIRPGLRLVIPEIAGETTRNFDNLGESTTYGSESVTAVSATAQNYYTVKSGDSLWTIAEKEYGNGSYSNLIKNANPNIDANKLKVGQKLVLPPKPAGSTGGTGSTTSGSSSESAESAPSSPAPSGPIPDDEPDFGL